MSLVFKFVSCLIFEFLLLMSSLVGKLIKLSLTNKLINSLPHQLKIQ